jgi:hypothetical protein
VAYLGNDLQVAFPTYRNIDDISGSFNGVTTSFPLTVGGVAPIPAPLNSQQCLISVNGVVQRPDDSGAEGFLLSGGNIVFASAPAGGVDFFGVILAGADYINIGANFPSGTALVPSITFDSDLDTGIYNPAGNQIGFTTAGVQRLVINSSGQVSGGLGSATTPAFSFLSDPNTGIYSPGADQVAVATNGTGRLANAAVTFSERVRITNAGLVGIGTSSPSKKLHVSAASGDVDALVECPGHPILRLKTTGTTDNTSVDFADSGSDTQCRLIYTHSTDLFRIVHSGNNALSIDSSGRVGIGTTSPAGILDIDVTGDQLVRFQTTAAMKTRLVTGNSDVSAIEFSDQAAYRAKIQVETSDAISFYTGGITTEAARLDSSGRLLVGTSSSTNVASSVGALVQTRFAGSFTNFAAIRESGPSVIAVGRANGSAAQIVANNDILGEIRFAGADGVDLETQAAVIKAEVDGTPGANDMPGRLVFSTTADGASSPTEQLRITSDRYVRLASGTGGIQFNGDTAAANALDDYEEGTWSPTIGGTAVYDIQWGYYIKIGKLVQCWGGLRPSSMGTGNARVIQGLPFTAIASPGSTQTGGGSIVYCDNSASSFYNTPAIQVIPNTTNCDIALKTGASIILQNVADFWQNNHRANFFITYQTN